MSIQHNIKYLSIILGAIFLTARSAEAQEGVEFGGYLGASHYFGDLNTDFSLNDPGIAVGFLGRYNFNERTAIKLTGTVGQVSAYDFDSNNTFERRRNLDFQSRILDLSGQFEFNFLPYVHGSETEFFTPYLFAGLSVTHFNPQTEVCNANPSVPASQCSGATSMVDLRPLGTEGQFQGEEYYTVAGGLAFGAGFKLSLNYEWSINVELSGRRLFTDYLDDVSTQYPDVDDLQNFRGPTAVALSDRSNPAIGAAGRQRGNENTKDAFGMLTVGIVYYFGDLKCPTPSR
ncbi:MAG: DUF6089 family protein [Bacteroidota bacterium]